MSLQNSAEVSNPAFVRSHDLSSSEFYDDLDVRRGSSTVHTDQRYSVYVRFGVKRFFDVCIAAMSILFFLPVFVFIAIALFWSDGSPIYFRHSRIGRDGKKFDCLKFRTMVKDFDEQLRKLLESDPERRKEWNETHKLRNDPRIRPIGAILRKSSLDELPQLINVLRGEMSIVGPRPIVTEEIFRYRDSFSTFASVRPGLTGLWQVSGRSDTSYGYRVALDIEYVRSVSLAQDVSILIRTVGVVLGGRGSF